MTTINVSTDRAVIEKLLVDNGIAFDKQSYSVEVWLDSAADNPWEAWDGQIPLMTSLKDYSDGGIEQYVWDMVTDAQLLEHKDFLLGEYYDMKYFENMDADARLDTLRDCISELFSGNLLHDIAELMDMFDIEHFHGSVKGYSLGDYAEVLMVPTTKWLEETGADVEGPFTYESSRQLYEWWAFGDVFGFSVVNNYGEVLDSCGGFFGLLWNSSSAEDMVEHIDLETYGWSKEEAIQMLKDAEVSYE